MLKYAQLLICFIFSNPKNVWFPNSNRFFFVLRPLNSESDTGFVLPCPVSAKLAECAKETDYCQMLSDIQSRQSKSIIQCFKKMFKIDYLPFSS